MLGGPVVEGAQYYLDLGFLLPNDVLDAKQVEKPAALVLKAIVGEQEQLGSEL